MKKTISKINFERAFRDFGRENEFSYEGLEALFDYLEEMEENCGINTELDVVDLCCRFTEYTTATSAACKHFEFEGKYDEDDGELETAEEIEDKALNFLRNRTQVIKFNNGIIIQEF